MKNLILLLSMILLVSCASSTKKARNFMQTGEWEKAREMWVLVLTKKPADKEALEGKQVAEFRTTNKYVVSARTKRTRGDFRGAMESSLTIHNLLKSWNISMDPDMAKYQSKDLRALYPAYLKLLETSIDNNTPLKSSFDQARYYPLFESKIESKYLTIKNSILELGKKRCGEISPMHMKLPFWRGFVSKVCNYYHVKNIKRGSRISQELFSSSKLLTNVIYMPSLDISIIRKNAIDAFKSSPWYHTAGKKQMSMSIVGDYKFSTRNWRERRLHRYSITNPQNKKKKITREFPYYVNSFKRIFRITLNSKIRIEDEEIAIPFQKEDLQTGSTYKGNSKPYIPRMTAKKSNKNEWFQKNYTDYKNIMLKNLKDHWTQKYCQTDPNASDSLSQGDYVIRCLRGQDDIHSEFLANWHKNNFGIDHKQMEQLIGKYY